MGVSCLNLEFKCAKNHGSSVVEDVLVPSPNIQLVHNYVAKCGLCLTNVESPVPTMLNIKDFLQCLGFPKVLYYLYEALIFTKSYFFVVLYSQLL